jgi:acetyl esterase
MMASYAPNHPVDEPLVSVLHADHHDLPPALVITAEHDVLRSDVHRYAEALRRAGVPVVHREYDGLPHGFLSMPRLTRAADSCLDLMAGEMVAALTAPAAERSA